VKVREFKLADGSPMAFLFDGHEPIFWANYWASNYKSGVSNKSRVVYMYDLCMVVLFFRYRKIDYIERFSANRFLIQSEIIKLRDCLSERKEIVEKRMAGLGVIKSETVCNSVYDRRCKIAYEFIMFLAQEISLDNSYEKLIALQNMEKNLKRHLRSTSAQDLKFIEPWSNEDFHQMNEAITSTAGGRSKFLTHRDLVVFHLLRETAVRNSELLGLMIHGFDRKKSGYITLEVKQNRDLRVDPRSCPATVKTNERELKVSDGLWTLIERYILERGKIRACKEHSFLIVNKSGRPLSNDSIGSIFKNLSKIMGKSITPHSFRHAWASNFIMREYEKSLKSSGNDRERIIASALSVLRAHMGWSLRSKMPEHYARYAFQKLGNDRLIDQANILSASLEKELGSD